MKKRFKIGLLITTGAFLVSFINFPHAPEISLNSPIPLSSEKLKTVSGNEVSLSDIKTKKGLLGNKWCKKCQNLLGSVKEKDSTNFRFASRSAAI